MLSYPDNRSGKSHRGLSGHRSTLSLKGWGARPSFDVQLAEREIATLEKPPAVLSNDYRGSSSPKLYGSFEIYSQQFNRITYGQTGE